MISSKKMDFNFFPSRTILPKKDPADGSNSCVTFKRALPIIATATFTHLLTRFVDLSGIICSEETKRSAFYSFEVSLFLRKESFPRGALIQHII